MDLARTGVSIGQLSNVWGLLQPQRHYFTLGAPGRNAGGLASCLGLADQPRRCDIDVGTTSPPYPQQRSKTSFRDVAAIRGVSFEALVAEPTRLAYSAHWRANNENSALTSFLKILGERYHLPTIGG